MATPAQRFRRILRILRRRREMMALRTRATSSGATPTRSTPSGATTAVSLPTPKPEEPEPEPIVEPTPEVPIHLDPTKKSTFTPVPGLTGIDPIKDVDIKPAPPGATIPEYTYGTGTVEQLVGQPDTGFSKPSEVKKRHEKMDLKKGHYIGRSDGKPVHVTVTEAQYHHGYTPGQHDPGVAQTYSKAEENINKNIEIVESNIEVAKTAGENIPGVIAFIKKLESAPAGTTITYTEISSSGKETVHENVTPSQALVFFKNHLGILQKTAGQLSTYKTTGQQLRDQRNIISGYKKYGYVLEETKEGSKEESKEEAKKEEAPAEDVKEEVKAEEVPAEEPKEEEAPKEEAKEESKEEVKEESVEEKK